MDSFRGLWPYSNQVMPLLAAIAFVLVLGVTGVVALCSGIVTLPQDETCVQCIREWTAALAGWGAAVVGAGAVIGAFINIKILREQISESKRQFQADKISDLTQKVWEVHSIWTSAQYYRSKYEYLEENLNRAADTNYPNEQVYVGHLRESVLRRPFEEVSTVANVPINIKVGMVNCDNRTKVLNADLAGLPDNIIIDQWLDRLVAIQ